MTPFADDELEGAPASLASALPPALLRKLQKRNGSANKASSGHPPPPAEKENGAEAAAMPVKVAASPVAPNPSSPRKKATSPQPSRPAISNSPSKIVLEQQAREEARRRRRAQQERARLEAPLDEASAFKAMIDAFRVSAPPVAPRAPAAPAQSQRLRVAVRKRPLLPFERDAGEFDVITCRGASGACVLHQTRKRVDQERVLENHVFSFDCLFDESSDTRHVYEAATRPLVASVFAGGRATCFAYGPTGSGKTHTMSGSGEATSADGVGIYGLVASDLFRGLAAANAAGGELSLGVSMFEIYRDQVLDLLAAAGGGGGAPKIAVLEDAAGEVQLVGLSEVEVGDAASVMRLLDLAQMARKTASNTVNERSSRSHALVQFVLRGPPEEPSAATASGVSRGAPAAAAAAIWGKFTLVRVTDHAPFTPLDAHLVAPPSLSASTSCCSPARHLPPRHLTPPTPHACRWTSPARSARPTLRTPTARHARRGPTSTAHSSLSRSASAQWTRGTPTSHSEGISSPWSCATRSPRMHRARS